MGLQGQTVLSLRSQDQLEDTVRLLKKAGAHCISLPVIIIRPPDDRYRRLDAAIGRISQYDLLIFTSVHGVDAFFNRLKKQSRRLPADIRAIAIGPATASAIYRHGIKHVSIPSAYTAEGVIDWFRRQIHHSRSFRSQYRRILLARAKDARPILPLQLRKMGFSVFVAQAYRTQAAVGVQKRIQAILTSRTIHWILFTSSSTARFFCRMARRERILKSGARIAAIGPVTARTLDNLGVPADLVARSSTIPGLVRAMLHASKRI